MLGHKQSHAEQERRMNLHVMIQLPETDTTLGFITYDTHILPLMMSAAEEK
jgi:hypothetical protein